jgi:predicted secreted protein
MASVRDQVIAAAVAAMNAGSAPGIAYRTRVDAFSAGELPAFAIYPATEALERVSVNVVKHTMTLRAEAMTAGVAPQDEALDPLLVYAVKTLYASAEFQTFLKDFSEERVQWQVEAAQDDIACAAQDFRVVFLTLANDPEALADVVSGYAGRVYVSDDDGVTFAEVAQLSNVELAIDVDLLDETNDDDDVPSKEISAGIASWTATASGMYVPDDDAQTKLLAAVQAGSPMKFRFDFDGTASGKRRFEGTGLIAPWRLTSRVGDMAGETVQINGSGLLAVSAQA